VAHTRRIADAAAEQEIEIAFEYHGGSLTDTQSSTMRLLRDIDHANVKSLWQPAVGVSHEDRLTGLQELSSRLSNIHCFQWGPGGGRDKRPLDQGEAEWSDYLSVVRAATPAPESRYVLLEFVRDNSEHAFLEDAETLGRWLARANPSPPG
jgi:sugar phosphate isomerase/epimerase